MDSSTEATTREAEALRILDAVLTATQERALFPPGGPRGDERVPLAVPVPSDALEAAQGLEVLEDRLLATAQLAAGLRASIRVGHLQSQELGGALLAAYQGLTMGVWRLAEAVEAGFRLEPA